MVLKMNSSGKLIIKNECVANYVNGVMLDECELCSYDLSLSLPPDLSQ